MVQEEIINRMDKIMRQKAEARSKCLQALNKHRNKNRKRRRKKEYILDDENVLEADIIKERKEELKKSMRAF